MNKIPIKGKRCVPIEEMKNTLKRLHVDLGVVDEYNTSKVCHECYFNEDNRKQWYVMDKYDHSERPQEYPTPVPDKFIVRKNFYDYKRTYFKVIL